MKWILLLLISMPVYATSYSSPEANANAEASQEQAQSQTADSSASVSVHEDNPVSSAAAIIIPRCASGISVQGDRLGISLADASYYCHLLDQAAAYQSAFKLCPKGPERDKAMADMHRHLQLADEYLASIAFVSKWSDIVVKVFKGALAIAGLVYLGILI